MEEFKPRNGYYPIDSINYPRVSTILKSCGNKESLIHWAAHQGAAGVAWGLSKLKDADALKEKLGSASCMEWAKEQGVAALSQERDRTAGFGTNVHSGIEAIIKSPMMDLDMSKFSEDEKTALNTFISFYKDVGIDPWGVELFVYSKQYIFAGKLDLAWDISEEQAKRIEPYLMKSSPSVQPGTTIADFKTGKLYVKEQTAQMSAYGVAYIERYDRAINGGLLINIPRESPKELKCFYVGKDDLFNAFVYGFMTGYQTWLYYDAPKWFLKQHEELKKLNQSQSTQQNAA